MSDRWDVIVVGSGMGGMVTAACLAKLGHKVLLLEKYSKLGGQTHSFSREGFRWDAGIHYLGGFATQDAPGKALLDWVCDTPIELAPIGSVYDTLHIGDSAPLQLSRPVAAQRLDLKERFPNEANAIDAWFDAIRDAKDALMVAAQVRSMPSVIGAALKWWNSRSLERFVNKTTAEVLKEITDNPDLTNFLVAQWGDFGGRPSTASFAIHAAVMWSYLEAGATYPVGGAAAFADHIIPTILAHGGEARAEVEVASLIIENDTVIGVETTQGEKLFATHIVSDIGARETVDQLLPSDNQQKDWVETIRSIGPNICHYSLFLGFSGDVKSAGMTRSNHWLYPLGKVDSVWSTAPNGIPPAMFVSFASLKDTAHDPGPQQKYAGELIAWTDWKTVQKWTDLSANERGQDYQDLKKEVENVLLRQFSRYFPRLADLIVFHEISTPLATRSITGHRMGSFYGLDVTPHRITTNALRAATPLKGLYLSGQDVATPGIPGALWGGFLAAASVDQKIFLRMKT